MREILFKAKERHTHKWVEGYYVKRGNMTFIYPTGPEVISRSLAKEIRPNHSVKSTQKKIKEVFLVDPETVCQYTGRTDKNGKKIFEGDIIKHYNNCPIQECSIDTGKIFWYQPTQRYLRTSSMFPDDCPELFEWNEYEVIGNIHDKENDHED